MILTGGADGRAKMFEGVDAAQKRNQDRGHGLSLQGAGGPGEGARRGQYSRKSAKMAVGRVVRPEMPVPRATICSLVAKPRRL